MLCLYITNFKYMQNNLFNINNIESSRNHALEIDNIPESQQVAVVAVQQKTISPLMTGILFGATRVAGDLISLGSLGEMSSLKATFLKTTLMQLLGKGVTYSYTNPQIANDANVITANIKSFFTENVGALSGLLSKFAVNYATEYQSKFSPNEAKIFSDFILLSTWFATGELFNNKCTPAISNTEIMKKIEKKDYLRFKNVSKKSIFFFIDVLSSSIAATACIYAEPMQNNPQNLLDTSVNGIASGTTFAIVQQTTKALLHKAYNMINSNSQQR